MPTVNASSRCIWSRVMRPSRGRPLAKLPIRVPLPAKWNPCASPGFRSPTRNELSGKERRVSERPRPSSDRRLRQRFSRLVRGPWPCQGVLLIFRNPVHNQFLISENADLPDAVHACRIMGIWLEDRLKALRANGKSKGGLALAMGVRNSAITEIISGKRKIAANELPKMAAYLEWSEPQLLTAISG